MLAVRSIYLVKEWCLVANEIQENGTESKNGECCYILYTSVASPKLRMRHMTHYTLTIRSCCWGVFSYILLV